MQGERALRCYVREKGRYRPCRPTVKVTYDARYTWPLTLTWRALTREGEEGVGRIASGVSVRAGRPSTALPSARGATRGQLHRGAGGWSIAQVRLHCPSQRAAPARPRRGVPTRRGSDRAFLRLSTQGKWEGCLPYTSQPDSNYVRTSHQSGRTGVELVSERGPRQQLSASQADQTPNHAESDERQAPDDIVGEGGGH